MKKELVYLCQRINGILTIALVKDGHILKVVIKPNERGVRIV